MSDAELTSRLERAQAFARDAGAVTLRYYCQHNYAVELKQDQSPVTVADRQAEERLRELIAEAFPDDAILGEELPERPGKSGYRWILDPIDGTKSFISGVPLYGTMIGVEFDSKSVVGVVYIPALDEMVSAAVGHGAWYSRGTATPRPARVSTKATLAESLFLTSEVKTFDRVGRRKAYERLEAGSRLTRTWGDCYGYLLVAVGRAEVMVDPMMNVWDCAALQPILEEAGGTFTDWNGQPTIYAGEAIATNGRLLDEVLAITREFPASK
jgi:histidinol phosphatase-like enzyme (inositol monophosphatase family)